MATVSYQSLRNDYMKYTRMSDEEFMANVQYAMHFAIYCCWYKENIAQQVLADDGVIHELHHLLLEREGWDQRGATKRLGEIRKTFERDLLLA